MAADPIFTATPKCALGTLSTANTNRDGTGTVVTLVTAGSSGSKIELIQIIGVGTISVAGMIRLYIYDGSNYFLWKEIPVPTVTPSASVAGWQFELPFTKVWLPNGYSLRASTEKSDTFKTKVWYGDY